MNFKKYSLWIASRFNAQKTRARMGASLIEKVILLAIALFILAFILPPALSAIATSVLTSVNSAVITLFQVLVPLIAIVGVILLVYRESGASVGV